MMLIQQITIWNYTFHSPWWWLGIPVAGILLYARNFYRDKRSIHYRFTRELSDLSEIENTTVPQLLKIANVLLFIGIMSFFIALSEPENLFQSELDEDYTEGIDIVISLDISGSMMATDFLPNRLEAAKEVAKEFVQKRKNDRIGLVVYEGEAYTACPTTKNHEYLMRSIDEVQSGWLEPGTAIGTGLGTAVSRLRENDVPSKVVILLSDGESNKGMISPEEATELAKNKKIRVYTIGVGKEGYAAMPVNTPFGTVMQNTKVNIDEKLLSKIAEQTGGKYFRATNKDKLREIYLKIDQMETAKIIEANVEKNPPVHPLPFLVIGWITVVLGLIIERKVYASYE